MPILSLADVCCAVTGRPKETLTDWVYVSEITQISSEVAPGALFVALKGARHDGHSFLEEAKQRGATAAIVERYMDVDIPQMLVPSSRVALGDLARLYRSRLNIPIVAITGSVGKTTTKEMVSHTLSKRLRVHRSRGNFNNELGVPIEMLRILPENNVSVLELAMRGSGQIEYLSRMSRPVIGVITNIGISHIEQLQSIDNIAKAKAELLIGMDACSLLVINADDKYFGYLRDRAPGRVVSFGEAEHSDYRITQLQLGKNGRPSFKLNGVPFTLERCVGKYNAINAAAVFAVATELGLRPEEIATQLSSFETPARRGKFSNSLSGATILDNTYNSAPDSVGASLSTLADLRSKNMRTVAVIGDMLELGHHSIEAHQRIGEMASEANLSLLVTVGQYSEYTGKSSGMAAWKHFPDAASAAEFLLKEVHKDDVVMVQGSRFMQLDTIVDALERGRLVDLPIE